MAQLSRHQSLASQHAPSKRSQKPALPHVSTLWQSGDPKRNTFDARKTLSSQRPSKQKSTPSSPSMGSLDLRSTPNIHMLAAMPEFGPDPGEVTPAKQYHRRNNSSDIQSPSSTQTSIHNGSVFELPTMPNESPNSSIRTAFLAELEDTSGLDYCPVPPMPTQLAPPTDTSILFKTNRLTSRAILKVVDETIAGIEASNRELLARAESAEASAYRLHVSNAELRSRVEELSGSHRPKSQVAMRSRGTQTISRKMPTNSPHTSIDHTNVNHTNKTRIIDRPSPRFNTHDQSFSKDPTTNPEQEAETTESETSNTPKPKPRRSFRSLKFLHRHHAEAFSLPLSNSSSTTIPAKSARASSDRPRIADGTISPSNQQTLIPPVPELPIFLSLTSHSDNIVDSKHKRVLSSGDAKKLATMQVPTSNSNNLAPPTSKNPLGEMSPSPVHGVVEIGMGGCDDEDRADVKPVQSQRSKVRFLLKETMLKELSKAEERKEKKVKDKSERSEKEKHGDKERRMSGFWKRAKKEEETVPPLPVSPLTH